MAGAVAWLAARAPALVAVDSPIRAAPGGARSRDGERSLARSVCGIRFTPDEPTLAADGSGYYEWIIHGRELYEALESWGIPAIECFPTATWTRLAGTRGVRSRARWSREALPLLGLDGIPRRTSQDGRDALAAAFMACSHTHGDTDRFGELVVSRGLRESPRAGSVRARL